MWRDYIFIECCEKSARESTLKCISIWSWTWNWNEFPMLNNPFCIILTMARARSCTAKSSPVLHWEDCTQELQSCSWALVTIKLIKNQSAKENVCVFLSQARIIHFHIRMHSQPMIFLFSQRKVLKLAYIAKGHNGTQWEGWWWSVHKTSLGLTTKLQ